MMDEIQRDIRSLAERTLTPTHLVPRYQFAEPERARESVVFTPLTPEQRARSRRILNHAMSWYAPKPTRWQRIKYRVMGWLTPKPRPIVLRLDRDG